MKSYLFVFFLIISSCAGISSTQFPPQPPQPASDTEYCAPAETKLKSLCQKDQINNKYCCDTVAPTKKNKSFTTVCQETQNQNIFLNPKCLSTITSCNQIDICTKTKQGI